MSQMSSDCAICLDSFTDEVVVLPSCLHKFHTNCFMTYIEANIESKVSVTCPICRNVVINIPQYDIIYTPRSSFPYGCLVCVLCFLMCVVTIIVCFIMIVT